MVISGHVIVNALLKATKGPKARTSKMTCNQMACQILSRLQYFSQSVNLVKCVCLKGISEMSYASGIKRE
jgi:hypothetical protein